MNPFARWTTTLWMAMAMLVAAAGSAVAQSGSTLPVYAEPTILSGSASQVYAADFTSDGIPDMAMWAGDEVTVYPGAGDGTFGAGLTSVAISGYYSRAWLGDFNGDGTLDFASAGLADFLSGTTEMGVIFGSGNGTFQPYRVVGTMPYESNPAVGDFDGDGRSDIAGSGCKGGFLGGDSSCGIFFLWGRADGNVDASRHDFDGGTLLRWLYGADFTGDGIPDIVTSLWGESHFDLLPGLGSRSFGTAIPHTSAGGPTAFAAADFNKDGQQDLAVVYNAGLGILHGNGNGTFQAVSFLGPLDAGGVGVPSNLQAWDIDSDTRTDLSINTFEGVALFLNTADGSFRRYALTASALEPHEHLAPLDYDAADFDDDGRPDFVQAWTDGKVGVYLGLASISTTLAASAATSTVSQAVSLTASVTPADLVGPVTFYDGALVLGTALLSGGQAVFTTTTLAPGAHALRAAYSGPMVNARVALSSPVAHTVNALPASALRTSVDNDFGFLPYGLAAGDLNRDGRTDLVSADYAYGNRVAVMLSNGDGTLQDPLMSVDIPPGTSPRFGPGWITVGEANQDGKVDVGLFNDAGGGAAYLGAGDGTITTTTVSPRLFRFADVNRDGKIDGLIGAGGLEVWLGLGDRRGFTLNFPSFSLAVASHYSEIVLGDFNGDLNLDVAMTTAAENRVYMVLGNGDGTFQTPRVNNVGNGPISPVAADINGDGKLDLVFVNAGNGKISVLPGKGDGDFLAAIDTTVGGTLTALDAADLSGDGKPDLAVLSQSEKRVLVLPGNGNGTFGAPKKYYAGTELVDVVVADFNGDGRMDLAVSSMENIAAGYGPGQINLLLGVNPAPTAVILDAVPATTTLSQMVTMTATVSPAIATGWVTFNDGATPIGSVPVTAGQAVFQTRLLGSGTHLLGAVFSGDGVLYGASVSAPETVNVAAQGVFEYAPSMPLSPYGAPGFAQADFNADGIVDLAICDTAGTSILLGQGNGQFTSVTPVPTPCATPLAADFNRDGHMDVAVTGYVLFGDGAGALSAPHAVAGAGGFVIAADFNGDGATDLFDGRVFLNRGAGTFESAIPIDADLAAWSWLTVAGDLNADGRADLVVPDLNNGSVHVLLSAGDGSFLPTASYPTVASPRAVLIADLNADGIPDLAVGGSTRIAIMLGLGPGTFENWGDMPAGLDPVGVLQLLACDLDGDGMVDLLVVGHNTYQINFVRGLGDGTFEAPVIYSSIERIGDVLLADLNQDGSPDLVHRLPGTSQVSVSMAVTESSLNLAASPDPAALSGLVTLTASVTPADATGTVTFYDDAVILGQAAISSGQASVTTKWLAAGMHRLRAFYSGDPLRYAASGSPIFTLIVAAGRNGGFGAPATLATALGPKALATGDLNADGHQDLVVANSTSNTISVFLGNGTGGFAPRVNYNTGSTPVAVVVADLNGDATPDVAVACAGSNAINLLYGNGSGTLQAAVVRTLEGSPRSLAAADLNMDGTMDLVVGTSSDGLLAALMGVGGAWPESGWSIIMGSGQNISGTMAVDMNNDGRVDLPICVTSGRVYRLLQEINGAFSSASSTVGTLTSGLAVGDFNGDGEVDLATSNAGSNDASVLLGNGDGTFQAAVPYATGTNPTAIATGDVDGDGHLDLVVANNGSNSLTLLHGLGDGTFVAGGTLATGVAPAGVVVGDFDGNGITDLAVTNTTDKTVGVYLGQAAPPTEGPRGDFTGDLKSDLLWRHATLGEVWLWPMNGPARTAESYVRTISDPNWEIRSQGDQTGDGQADLLWRHTVTGQLYFWPMAGGLPQDEIYVATVDPAYDIVGSGDFDGDGKSDLVWHNGLNGEVWVWLMDGATPLGEVYVATVDLAYTVKGVGDLDGDGRADLVWHGTAGDVWVWPMQGTTRLAEVWVGTVPDAEYQIQGVADFTGDGQADLLWWHATRGEVWIWTMNGTTRTAETWVATVPDTTYRIAATGDYDGDTKADLAWWNTVNGEVWVWLMNGPVRVSETWVATVPDTGYRIIR